MTASANNVRPAIARIWRGRTTAAKADEYAGYLYEHGIKPLVEKALGVQMLRGGDQDGVDVLVVEQVPVVEIGFRVGDFGLGFFQALQVLVQLLLGQPGLLAQEFGLFADRAEEVRGTVRIVRRLRPLFRPLFR